MFRVKRWCVLSPCCPFTARAGHPVQRGQANFHTLTPLSDAHRVFVFERRLSLLQHAVFLPGCCRAACRLHLHEGLQLFGAGSGVPQHGQLEACFRVQ